jgi:hypothetical protein
MENFLRLKYGLSEQSAKLLQLLLHAEFVPAEAIWRVVQVTPYVPMRRLRQALVTHEVTIHNRPGMGYFLDPSDKAKIRNEHREWEASQ